MNGFAPPSGWTLAGWTLAALLALGGWAAWAAWGDRLAFDLAAAFCL